MKLVVYLQNIVEPTVRACHTRVNHIDKRKLFVPFQNTDLVSRPRPHSATMRWICILVLVALVYQIQADVANGTITLGISLTNSPRNSSRSLQGAKILRGLYHWLETVNNSSNPIRGQIYKFELKVLNDNGSTASVRNNYDTLLSDPTVDYLLGPVGAEASNPISALTNSNGRLLIGTSVGSVAFYAGKDFSYSVVTAATRCPSVAFPYFRLNRGRRIALLISQATLTKEACEGLTTQVAAANGLEIVVSYDIHSSLGNVSQVAIDEIESLTLDLLEKEVDTVIGCAFGDTAKVVMEKFHDHDYAPSFVTFLPFNDLHAGIDQELNDFMTGCSRFEANANFPGESIFGSTQDFVSRYQARYNTTPDDYAAFGAMAGLLYQYAIEQAPSFSQVDVRDTLERLNMDTFMGQLSFGVDNSNQLSCLFVQMVNGSRKVVGPPLAQIEEFELVDPFPTWTERVFVRSFNAYSSEWVFFVLAILGFLFSLALLFYTVGARETPIIKASSPNLLIIFLIGSMFLYASIWTWTLSNVTAAGCYLQSWLLSFGFTIMFGALFAKSWRVYKLSTNKSLKIFKISDTQLIIILLCLLTGDALICAVQAGLIDMNPTRFQVDVYRPVYDYEECPSGNAVTGIAAALIAYNGVIGLAGLVIAFKIRRLRYSLYNESKIIAFSMYNAAFFALLVIVLQFTNATDRALLYILRSAGIMLGTGVSVATLFVTKLTMDREKHSSHQRGTITTNSSDQSRDKSNHNNSSTHDLTKKLEEKERELVKLKKKNENASDKTSNAYYQLKYEKLYHENMIIKNELFELKNLIQRFKRSEEAGSHPINEKSKNESSSE